MKFVSADPCSGVVSGIPCMGDTADGQTPPSGGGRNLAVAKCRVTAENVRSSVQDSLRRCPGWYKTALVVEGCHTALHAAQNRVTMKLLVRQPSIQF